MSTENQGGISDRSTYDVWNDRCWHSLWAGSVGAAYVVLLINARDRKIIIWNDVAMHKYIKYLGLLFGVTAFIYFTYSGLTRDKIESKDDLTELKGKFVRYSFTDGTGFKGNGQEYYFWLDNYQNAFQIPADYLRVFRGREFVSAIKSGDDIALTIPKSKANKLNSPDENVFVTSIRVKWSTYLNKEEVLKIEKELATSYAEYIIGTLYLIAGVVIYFRNR
jgi:hypothetical protein